MEMTETRDEAEISAGQAGSAEPSSETEPQAPGYQCAWCDFVGGSARALGVHVSKKHPEHRDRRPPSRRAPTSQAPPMSEPAGPPPPDLKDLKRKTQANIKTVGQMLEGLLVGAHARAIMNPQSRIPVKDTHLAYALQLRDELAADVWIKHAQNNPTLMTMLQGFNRLFEGGEETMLFASLALSAMATFGRPAPDPVNGMFAGDIFQKAAQTDQEIRSRIAMAQQQYERQQAAAAAQSNGRPTGVVE